MCFVNAPLGRQQGAEIVQVVTTRIVPSASDETGLQGLLRCLLCKVAGLPGRHVLVEDTGHCREQVFFGETKPP